jgi:NAD(P)-dependent dehydrogenase (short-subunit alcohol dehydrogenase family)
VTGGASGIGAAVARRLSRDGAGVVIAGRRRALGEATAGDLRAAGGRAVFVPADVTVPADVDRLVEAAVDSYGRLDGAFNNAGDVTARAPIIAVDDAAWHADLTSNLTSVFHCLRAQLPAMRDGGSIVNNASIAGVSGTPGLAAYTAAKHGVVGLTRSAALEAADRGIRVNALVTGNVDTPLYRRLLGVPADGQLPRAPNPTGRTATPDEVASFVVYLLSDDAAFITGAALAVDGGFTAH